MDQFRPDENLGNFLVLEEELKRRDLILGTGARSIPVNLAHNEENNYLRRIMEGIYNLGVRKAVATLGKEIVYLDAGNVSDPAFSNEGHGDFITGVYVFNPDARHAQSLSSRVLNTARTNDFIGFEDEYYLGIEAAGHGLVSQTFSSRPNPFSQVDLEEEKKRIIEKQIRGPMEKVSRTGAMKHLRKLDELDYEALERFYSTEQVREVRTYMGV